MDVADTPDTLQAFSIIDRLLKPQDGDAVVMLTDTAARYLETKGLTRSDIALLKELCRDFEREKAIAARQGRSDISVRKQLQRIRTKLGARSQTDLARMIGVLSCLGEVRR